MEKIKFNVKKFNNQTLNSLYKEVNESENIEVNHQYFSKDGKPWFPIMGEFHYFRYQSNNWTTELAKMKSGGLDIVASYIPWIYHEEVQGEWDFSGQNNLRKFIELCQKNQLYFFLRIGPWAHAEIRNGGFPDWIQNSDINLRTNDTRYLAAVSRFFSKLYTQCEHLLYKDGGPIIGIQIENEYGHAGGLNGSDGVEHMKVLKQMLDDIGFDVPFYTATAWGGGVFLKDITLPVYGGYAAAPWDSKMRLSPLNKNYLIVPFRDDPQIASDFNKLNSKIKENNTSSDSPYITVELGGGIQVTKKNRPVITANDTEAMILAKIASGVNLLGYYMYHGGSNQVGKQSYLQESTTTGSYTDVPIINYDFQAPISQSGEFRESYGRLRKIHQFIDTFQEILAPAIPLFPADIVMSAENTSNLRFDVRHNYQIGGGFIFINNYQRHHKMKNHDHTQFEIMIGEKTIKTPEINIRDGEFGIFPYNLPVCNSFIISSNASLYCIVADTLVFYMNEPDNINIIFDGKAPKYKVISTEQANKSILFKNQLLFSEGSMWVNNGELNIASLNKSEDVTNLISGNKQTIYYQSADPKLSVLEIKSIKSEQKKKYLLSISYDYGSSGEIFLDISFLGDRAEFYIDGKLVEDYFQIDNNYKFSLSMLAKPEKLELIIYETNLDTYYDEQLRAGCKLLSAHLDVMNIATVSI